MSNSKLQDAIDCLSIQDVFQRAAVSKISDTFDPKYSSIDEIGIQLKHIVKRSEVVQLEENGESCIFRVYVELGVRWASVDVDHKAVNDKNSVEIEQSADILAFIEATYVAEYLLDGKPGKEALDEFALKNASYHIWPYWREYIMSQGMRMNLPKYTLPAVQFASNKSGIENAKGSVEKDPVN
jgi:hypothetical protein